MSTHEHTHHHGPSHTAPSDSQAHPARPEGGEHGSPSGHGGHGGHGSHGDHVAIFRDRFWASLILAVPVVYFSPMFAELLGYHIIEFPGSTWIAPVLGSIIYFWAGWPFLSGAVGEVAKRQPGMMLLIAMAITVAYAASMATSFSVGGLMLDFWWELALLVVIMLLGHWLEMRALGAASSALDALAELLPEDAEKVVDGEILTVPIAELAPGDVVLVRSGSRVPADGVIVEGTALFDESMITGESRPVERAVDGAVVAGTVATDSSVRVRVEKTGEDTALAGIHKMVAEAQSSSSRAQALADRAAGWLFWFALITALITAVVWLSVGSPNDAITRTVTVLIIACPHALGLAIPLVISNSTELAAANGLLIRNRMALEKMREVDVVLFDKTGTLTQGAHAVTDAVAAAGVDKQEMLRLAAAAEMDSEHPVARAIVAAAGAGVPHAANFRAAAGRGVRATVDGAEVTVGGPTMLAELGPTLEPGLDDATRAWIERGAGVIYVVRDGRVIGAVAVEDEIRSESRDAVTALHERGIRVAMITGDARQVADAVAAQLGIDEVFAEVLPEDKDKAVIELQGRGLTVAMVGDGVNDAPALARADVGIAIGAGTDVAMESADVILAGNDPRAVVSMILLSARSYRKMVQNLVWAAGYNIVAVPLAAGVLAPVGFVLPPAVGAILMSLSTIIVAVNAMTLRSLNLDPAEVAPTAGGVPESDRARISLS